MSFPFSIIWISYLISFFRRCSSERVNIGEREGGLFHRKRWLHGMPENYTRWIAFRQSADLFDKMHLNASIFKLKSKTMIISFLRFSWNFNNIFQLRVKLIAFLTTHVHLFVYIRNSCYFLFFLGLPRWMKRRWIRPNQEVFHFRRKIFASLTWYSSMGLKFSLFISLSLSLSLAYNAEGNLDMFNPFTCWR